MKPLELNHYRRCDCGPDCTVYVDARMEGPDIFEGFSPWHVTAKGDKRLTDPELAAEFWFADGQLAYAMDLPSERMRIRYERYATIKRFAERPHHDEEGR